MNNDEILKILKMDLQISVNGYDDYLSKTIELSKAAIHREGITLDEESTEDGMLVEMYAAYLYRKRRENIPMPRSLRYELNNKLISQKGSTDNG